MVSDVICLAMFDRIWCILTTIFCLTCMQVNIRAVYKHLYDLNACKGWNDVLLGFGVFICISFPLIGFFDEHLYQIQHLGLSVFFFSSMCFYANILAHELWEH